MNAVANSEDSPVNTSGHRGALAPPRRILFVCDGTVAAGHAFESALQIAKDHAALLRGVCIIRHLPVAADLIAESSLKRDEAACSSMLSTFSAAASAAGVRMDAEVVFGVPREQIVRQIREFDIDLLVMPETQIGFFAGALQRSIVRQTQQRAVTIMTVDREGLALLTV